MSSANTKTDVFGDPLTTIDYSGELDLMFYEGSSGKAGIQAVVHTDNPEESDLLLKTVSGGEPHGGGTFWNNTAPDYIAIKQWIAEGALKN